MFFVSGITGHVGGVAARVLLEQGKSARILAMKIEQVAARGTSNGAHKPQFV